MVENVYFPLNLKNIFSKQKKKNTEEEPADLLEETKLFYRSSSDIGDHIEE